MMLSEAARTGRRFRRKDSDPGVWLRLDGLKMIMIHPDINGSVDVEINAEMIVANDWECEPKVVSVEAKDLRRAVTNLGTKGMRPSDVVEHIIKELGFNDVN